MNAAAGTLQPDKLFRNRYRIVRVIKAGGMGAVYEVLDEATGTRRALKVMLPRLVESDELRARFALEARITGSIESDHIVRTSDAGVDEETGTPFIVMELLRGEELGSLLSKRGALSPEEVTLYLFQASLALDRTHAAGIVHRDLKPDNLFVTVRDDGTPCVKILDFGIAKVVEQHQHATTTTQQLVGTPLYMSPEQLRAERNVGPRADIHALGHLAYALLVGESYWSEESEKNRSPYLLAADMLRGATEPPSMRAWRRKGHALPEGFDAWFMRATAPQPADRFERASAAVAALADALGVEPPRAQRAVLIPDPTSAAQDADDETLPSLRPSQPFPPPPTISSALAAPPSARAPISTQQPSSSQRGSTIVRPSAAAEAKHKDPLARRDRAPQRRFEVRADTTNGILRVKVWGFWDVEEGKAYLEEFRQKAAILFGRPWYVLANVADFPPQKAEVSPYVEQTMAYARANGMRKAANLVNSALSKMQIARLSADTGLPEFSFFTSEPDAVAWLLRDG